MTARVHGPIRQTRVRPAWLAAGFASDPEVRSPELPFPAATLVPPWDSLADATANHAGPSPHSPKGSGTIRRKQNGERQRPSPESAGAHRTLRPASSGPGWARADAGSPCPPSSSFPGSCRRIRLAARRMPGLPDCNLHGNPLTSVGSAVDEPGPQARDRAGHFAISIQLQCSLVDQVLSEHLGVHSLGQAP